MINYKNYSECTHIEQLKKDFSSGKITLIDLINNVLEIGLDINMEKTTILINYGDNSCDGHNQTSNFAIFSNGNKKQIEKAINGIKEKTGFDINDFCNGYKQNFITSEHYKILEKNQINFKCKDDTSVEHEEFIKILIALINKTNPKLEIELNETFDDEFNIYCNIGYGLFDI